MSTLITYSKLQYAKALKNELQSIQRKLKKLKSYGNVTKTGERKNEEAKRLMEYQNIVISEYEQVSKQIYDWLNNQTSVEDWEKQQIIEFYIKNKQGFAVDRNGNISRTARRIFNL